MIRLPNPHFSEVKIGADIFPLCIRCCNPRMRLPYSRSSATKVGITARTLNFAMSPPNTPASSGAAMVFATSSPKCRITKSRTDSSRWPSPASSAAAFNCSASSGSRRYASLACSLNRVEFITLSNCVGTIIRMPSGMAVSVLPSAIYVLRLASLEGTNSFSRPSSIASSRAHGFSVTQLSGPHSMTNSSRRTVSTMPPSRELASNKTNSIAAPARCCRATS